MLLLAGYWDMAWETMARVLATAKKESVSSALKEIASLNSSAPTKRGSLKSSVSSKSASLSNSVQISRASNAGKTALMPKLALTTVRAL